MTTRPPRVSVVIPAYNAAATLAATLESVFAQTFEDFEVIVVDDGSSDDTAAVAASFGPRVRCLRVPNGGVSRARNHGIADARGEFVALLDADDLWDASKLARQFSALDADPHAGVCLTGLRWVDENLEPLGENWARPCEDYREELLLYAQVAGSLSSSAMLRRELLQGIEGFDPQFTTAADWDLTLRLSRITGFAVIREPLFSYRAVAASMSRSAEVLERDTIGVLDKFFAEETDPRYLRLRRRAYGNHWVVVSGAWLQAGQPRQALRCLARGLLLNPRNVRRPLGLPMRWLRRRTAAPLAS